ncbi:Hypothetical predicted protein [Lecanosticta acicola]|uniref:Uncharacterized protein n=1 Tax=Lecanosticta acicola TaxID=111012 RepID=A0AAI8Z5R4_9PEZI|nr:Hypothetical predicted protein [Lecanosticta acicola]
MMQSISEKAQRVLGLETKTTSTPAPPFPAVEPGDQIKCIVIIANTTERAPSTLPTTETYPTSYNGTLCRLRSISLPSKLAENTQWKTSEISVRLGFPLKFARAASTPDSRRNDYNSQSHLFMIDVDEKSGNFGKFSVDSVVGDVVVARADMKPLLKHELAIMTEYISQYIAEGVRGLPDLDQSAGESIRKMWMLDHLDPVLFYHHTDRELSERIKNGILNEHETKNPVALPDKSEYR